MSTSIANLPTDKMATTSFVICIESSDQCNWLRTQMANGKFVIIESTIYWDTEGKGYAMNFDSIQEGVKWIEDRVNNGWTITLVAETLPLAESILKAAHNRIFRNLKQI